MGELVLLIVAGVIVLGASALFLVAYLLDAVGSSIERAADKRQQREYERHEWEMSIGRDRATLLRPGIEVSDPSRELVRSSGNSSAVESDALLHPSDVSGAGTTARRL